MAASDEAHRLLAKAGEDEYVLDRLIEDPGAPEAIIGFHAQQAAEKLLKAALFLAGVSPPRTHNLAELLDLAAASDLKLPEESEVLRWLTPYAVLYRYEGDAEADAEELARQDTRENLRRLRAWVQARLAASKHSTDENP